MNDLFNFHKFLVEGILLKEETEPQNISLEDLQTALNLIEELELEMIENKTIKDNGTYVDKFADIKSLLYPKPTQN